MSEAGRVWQVVRGRAPGRAPCRACGERWISDGGPLAGLGRAPALDLVDDETGLWEAAYRRVRDGVRLLVCRTGGQYLSSCFAPKARTPGGDGVMSPSQIRKVRRNSLSRTFLPTLRAVRPADVAQRGRAGCSGARLGWRGLAGEAVEPLAACGCCGTAGQLWAGLRGERGPREAGAG